MKNRIEQKWLEVLKQFVTKQTPKTEKVCETKRVPINQPNQGFGADNLIGALIGGAIGNQLGKGGGKQGSTAIATKHRPQRNCPF